MKEGTLCGISRDTMKGSNVVCYIGKDGITAETKGVARLGEVAALSNSSSARLGGRGTGRSLLSGRRGLARFARRHAMRWRFARRRAMRRRSAWRRAKGRRSAKEHKAAKVKAKKLFSKMKDRADKRRAFARRLAMRRRASLIGQRACT